MKHPNGAKTKNGDLCSQINVDHFSDLSQEEQASSINSAFLEPLKEHKLPALLEHLPQEDILEILRVSESQPHQSYWTGHNLELATQGVR